MYLLLIKRGDKHITKIFSYSAVLIIRDSSDKNIVQSQDYKPIETV